MLLFGRLADVAGWRERMFEAPDLASLRRAIYEADARLGEALRASGVQAAVDRLIVRGEAALTPASEVAFMPPMSGG